MVTMFRIFFVSVFTLTPILSHAVIQKWTPKIGQRDKCCLGSCCHPGGVLVIHTVRRLPVKRLMPTFGIVERKVPA